MTNEVVEYLRDAATVLQSDLDRWPMEARTENPGAGGYAALSKDAAMWRAAADEIERLRATNKKLHRRAQQLEGSNYGVVMADLRTRLEAAERRAVASGETPTESK